MKTASLMFCIAALLASTSHAAPKAHPGAEACKADAEKLCAGIAPGNGAIHRCLKRHEAELSPACAKFQTAVRNKIRVFVQACNSDIKTHCSEVEPGNGRVVQCLKANRMALADSCKAQLAEARQ